MIFLCFWQLREQCIDSAPPNHNYLNFLLNISGKATATGTTAGSNNQISLVIADIKKDYTFILPVLILQGNTLLILKLKKEKSMHVNVVLWSEVLGASDGEPQLDGTGWTGGLKFRQCQVLI